MNSSHLADFKYLRKEFDDLVVDDSCSSCSEVSEEDSLSESLHIRDENLSDISPMKSAFAKHCSSDDSSEDGDTKSYLSHFSLAKRPGIDE